MESGLAVNDREIPRLEKVRRQLGLWSAESPDMLRHLELLDSLIHDNLM
jgi:hypothetical protein